MTKPRPRPAPPCDLEHVRQRCREVGKCWEWAGAVSNGHYPKITVARRQYMVRHLVYMLRHVRPLPRGLVLIPRCRNQRCVAPWHIQARTKAQAARLHAQAGAYRVFSAAPHRAKIAIGRRRNSKLSDAAVAEVRHSSEAARVLARRHGISTTYVYQLRRGEFRRDYSSPWQGLI
jgi:hypothetical protein